MLGLKLRCLYALHMVMPMRLVRWHVERLPERTIQALLGLYFVTENDMTTERGRRSVR